MHEQRALFNFGHAIFECKGDCSFKLETRLLEQVVVALITGLDAAGRVHGPRAGRPRVVHETRVEGLAVHLGSESVVS